MNGYKTTGRFSDEESGRLWKGMFKEPLLGRETIDLNDIVSDSNSLVPPEAGGAD